ncbi:D-allose transport system permease protein AlsC [Baekduia alba]|uniref:ABC transporter permease n=1 Tax=Baekduia alba TaxID=2997333 RepID=UPI00234100D2|nr:ABC transporter permease [Baekduia alba]WCB91787.1 D-allose transport system permease protein AlsC [Baekduia alba]
MLRALSFRNVSALYVFVVVFVVFSLWIPQTFLDVDVWRTLLDANAITALVAVGLVLPLAAGSFNLAIGAEVGLGAILVAWLLSNRGSPIGVSIAVTLVAGAAVGALNGLLIVKARIDSFIATMGMSSILLALIAWISDSQQILGLSSSFQSMARSEVLGITLPVYILLAVALGVWYVLERTPAGRRVYATGGNAEAARLAGVRTSSVVLVSLVACGVITALAGILTSSRIAAGDPTIGPPLLLPAFAAAFLGSTQFRRGRFNVWGTVVAVYVLATGIKGLQLAGAPVWIPDLFNGVALLAAVGLAKYERFGAHAGAIRRLLRFERRSGPVLDAGPHEA